jgi:hypothetical protein
MEILKTGGLERIKYENTQDVEATRTFQGIYGVGTRPASIGILSLLTGHIICRAKDRIPMVCMWLSHAG